MSSYSLEDTIDQLQHSPNPQERLFAAFRLGRDRDPRVVAPLIAALNDTDAAVRVRAAEALGTRDEAHVVPVLVALLEDADADVRRMAVQSLGRIGQESAFDALLAALADADDSMRVQAAEALGNLPPHLTAQALVAAFLQDPAPAVQTAARQSLAQPGNHHAASLLLDALPAAHDQPALLLDLLQALGEIADPSSRAALQSLCDHPDDDICAMARWAFSRIRG
jgi:HEAT repeat protein